MKKLASAEFRKQHLFQAGGTVLLLTLFLGVFLFFYFQFRASTLQSITIANESFGNYVDSVLTLSNANIRTSAMQIFYTSSIRKLRTGSELSVAERTIGHRDLGNFVSSSTFIENVMIYNRNMDMIFTSESSYSSASSEKFHDRDAVSVLTGSRRQVYLTPFRRQSGGTMYYSFLFYDDTSAGYSSMLLDINADWYETHLLGSNQQNRHVIVDKTGSPVIYRDSSIELPEQSALKASFDSAPESGYILAENLVLPDSCWVYHRLGNTGWYFMERFELKEDVPGLVRIQRAVVAVFALTGLAILCLSVYLFFVILPSFLHISRAVTQPDSEKKSISEKVDELLSSHSAYQASCRLRELKAGTLPEGMTLPIVVLAVPSGGEKIAASVRSLLPGSEVIPVRSEAEDVVIVTNCTNMDRNLIPGCLRELRLSAPVCLSSPCYSEEQIRDAFRTLGELSQVSFLYPNQSVLQEEMLSECSEDGALLKKSVSVIESSLKKGQPDMAHAQWLILFDSIRRARSGDFFFAVHYMDRMMSAIEEELDMNSAVPVPDRFSSVSELHGYMDERFRAITDTVNEQQRNSAEALTQKVWEMIYDGYHDENCCGQQIADRLNISPSSLNRQFRSAAGISVGDAIQSVRIDRVCSLLRQTELSVEQIACQVGISNTKYLFVLFKKHTGMTPAQFRSSVCSRGR